MPPDGRDVPPRKLPSDEGGVSREVIFEFQPIGGSVKVSAVDAATGIEVSIVGPAHAPSKELQRIALQKLQLRLKRDEDPDMAADKKTPPSGPAGPKGGIIV